MADPNTAADVASSLATLRTFSPNGTTGIYAYYDGRTCPWDASNWYTETLALGVAAYSIVSGSSALLFDAGLTPAHAVHMLEHVQSLGASDITTVYSHFHGDHIAGASALRKTKIIAHETTQQILAKDEQRLRNPGEGEGPSIDVVFPAETYKKRLVLQIGDIKAELHNFNIHSPDSTLLFLPDSGLAFAGDMVEDTVTLLAEPEHVDTHLRELERMAQLPIRMILPAHGSPERIQAGGFDKSLIDATIRYLKALTEPVDQPVAWTKTLKEVLNEDLADGRLVYYEAYEGVHAENIESIKETREEEADAKLMWDTIRR